MRTEDPFLEKTAALLRAQFALPIVIETKANLLYEVTVNNRLELDQIDLKRPIRGQSAFQTDVAVFEQIASDIRLPRIVMEFKKSITTHDVLTYSTKAIKHKQVYPYLRYGLVISSEESIPGRVFAHNDALDFVIACAGYSEPEQKKAFQQLIQAELRASRSLEAILYGKKIVQCFRTEIEC